MHCDLKPDNILVGYLENDPLIYLVDFGLAHCYIDKRGRHEKQPKKVHFKGSISYCSLNLLDNQRKILTVHQLKTLPEETTLNL